MNMQDPNVVAVELVAEALGSLCNELVLVGGCAVGLLITDGARPPIRATRDVDLVAEVASLASYYELREKLESRGFRDQGDIICRWCKGALIIDVMPTTEVGFGSTNRWYPLAVQHAQRVQLPRGSEIRLVSAPLFVATKLESFHDRGNGDYLHHDIEDIVNLVDGRFELIQEVENGPQLVREFIREEFDDLLADYTFMEQLPGHLNTDDSSQRRVPIIIERMRNLAGL